MSVELARWSQFDLVGWGQEDLVETFISRVSRGDRYAAGAWLRPVARDPGVNPWLLLDQLTTPDMSLPGPHPRPPGGSAARLVSADSTGRGRAG
jgi:hypothetical protein